MCDDNCIAFTKCTCMQETIARPGRATTLADIDIDLYADLFSGPGPSSVVQAPSSIDHASRVQQAPTTDGVPSECAAALTPALLAVCATATPAQENDVAQAQTSLADVFHAHDLLEVEICRCTHSSNCNSMHGHATGAAKSPLYALLVLWFGKGRIEL